MLCKKCKKCICESNFRLFQLSLKPIRGSLRWRMLWSSSSGSLLAFSPFGAEQRGLGLREKPPFASGQIFNVLCALHWVTRPEISPETDTETFFETKYFRNRYWDLFFRLSLRLFSTANFLRLRLRLQNQIFWEGCWDFFWIWHQIQALAENFHL